MHFSITSFFRKVIRSMLLILLLLLTSLLLLTGALFIASPGKMKPYLGKNGKPLEGSISEKIYISINGIKQGMFVKSRNASNPVLLYLHGGLPDYFLDQKYPTGLDEYFTMVWWEQRGSGMSYSSDIPADSISLEQMIADTKEVTNYLRKRFGKEKIYLMGHSGGTFIAIQAAKQSPGLFYAYIGVAQMSDQLKSERLAWEYMLNRFRDNGNREIVRKLEACPVSLTDGTPDAYLAMRDNCMHSLGVGTTHDMNSVITGIFLPSLKCSEYTIKEKFYLWLGKSRSGVSSLWKNMLATDLSEQLPELEIPVYFIHGIYDFTVSYTLAKEYFDTLKAPVKGFYTFDKSAHSPLFEEPDKMIKIMKTDVLTGSNSLSDTRQTLQTK
jgi:pimeloyl-ACP methyl ester carboxylesterase